MSTPTAAGTGVHDIATKLFAGKRANIADLPVLRGMLSDFGPRVGAMLAQCAGLNVGVTLSSLSQATLSELAAPHAAGVVIWGTIPEWHEQAICKLDRMMLFSAFDAMYGGVPGARTQAPNRPLTSLERSLASLLGGGLMRLLAETLREACKYSIQSECYAEVRDLEVLARKKGEYLVVRLRIEERDDSAVLAIPVVRLEYVRDRLMAADDGAAKNPDPNFTKAFRRVVASTPIQIVASTEGPAMLLSDVARLHPGSALEFDGSSLRQVLVEAGARPIFTGRLGQSKGVFTICLERAIAPTAPSDDDTQD